MLILYKNDRNVRFVLFTKTSNITGLIVVKSSEEFQLNQDEDEDRTCLSDFTSLCLLQILLGKKMLLLFIFFF